MEFGTPAAMAQTPLSVVVQELVGLVTPFHDPLTVAFATGLWASSWTITVTDTVQKLLVGLMAASRSPMCTPGNPTSNE